MPYVNGRYFKFNPALIAKLIYEGHEVTPDYNVAPGQIGEEKAQIDVFLRQLWGKQKSRTIQGSFTNKPKNRWQGGSVDINLPEVQPFETSALRVIFNPFFQKFNMPAPSPQSDIQAINDTVQKIRDLPQSDIQEINNTIQKAGYLFYPNGKKIT